jgi:hypothetical protein
MTDDSKRKRRTEAARQWHREHPNYSRIHRQRQREFADAHGLARDGTIPVKPQKKISYTIHVRRPLSPGERVATRNKPITQRRKKKSHEEPFHHSPPNQADTFEPTDTW